MSARRIEEKLYKLSVTNATVFLELPFPPSANNLFLNRHGRIKTPEYRAWSKEAAQMLMIQRPRIAVGPVEIYIVLEEKKGRRDLDNFAFKAILDCLVQNGIIADDHNKIVRKLSARWGDVVGALVEIRPAWPSVTA